MKGGRPKEAHVWDQDPHGWYVEPERCTEQLAKREKFIGTIHDPCCGGGNIVRVLRRAGYHATGSDIVARQGQDPEWYLGEHDFLYGPLGLFGADNCVFNPPFFRAKGAEGCIRLALQLAPRKVAAFVESRFVYGANRARGLYHEFPPARLYPIANRPSCPPGTFLAAGGDAEGGTQDYCWIVWERGHVGATEMRWLL